MARKEPTSGGDAQRHTRGGHASQRRSRGARRSRGKYRAHAAPHQAQAGQTGPRAEHPTAGSVWARTAGIPGVAGTGGALRPLLTLSPDQPAADMTLTLVGAQQAALSEALQAWGIAQDLAANRAWRRPGGLTRMAGL